MGSIFAKQNRRIEQLVTQTNQLTALVAKQQEQLMTLTKKMFDVSRAPPPKPDVPDETRQEVCLLRIRACVRACTASQVCMARQLASGSQCHTGTRCRRR